MPKEVYKIDKFHGGLNTNADPRDIEENELSEATDIMVDEVGTIRMLGSAVNHEAFTATSSRPFTGTITAGYGLFHWSSDRKGAHVLNADLSGTHTGGDSDTILTDGSATFPVDGLIGARLNNTTDGSSGTITDNTGTTATVDDLTGGSDNSFDDAANDAYTIDNFPTTGDNYLAYSDADTTGTVSIYSYASDTWGETITGLTNVSGGNRNDVFSAVDGELRVCDGNFENSNLSQWYGYIDRTLFSNIADTVTVNQWYQTGQAISPPDSTSEFDQVITTSTLNAGHTYDSGDSDKNQDFEITADALYDGNSGTHATDGLLNMKGFLEVTVRITTASYGTLIPAPTSFAISYRLTTGSANLSTNAFAGVSGTNYKISDKSETASFSPGDTRDIVYTLDMGDHYYDAGGDGSTFDNGDTTYGIKTTLTSISFDSNFVTGVDIRKVRVQEASPSDNTIDELTTGNVHLQIAYDTPDTSDAVAIGWDKIWEYGVSFIYDGKQESLVRRLFDSSASDTTEQNNSNGPAKSPTAKMYFKHGTATNFNRRITGAVWYIREASGGASANAWTAQVEYDFVKGVSRVLSTGKEIDCSYDAAALYGSAADGHYIFEVDDDNLLSPNLVDTYYSRTGVSNKETSIIARYKTSALANRRMYIGNVLITNDDGTTEVKADAMLKSSVNSFDVFPSLSVVEAAVNDGESIVAIEEFADRILQFKENSLYIINVAQNIEFLEDTHKFKGVSQPSAVCKTDYGIAWANKYGCFFYDGRNVHNLLEKKGMQKIKDHGTDSWETFSVQNPMIGYLPKKRQLLIVDDNTSSGNGAILIYDMVTQSWVRGGAASLVSDTSTNFITDVNGNLALASDSTTATLHKWDDDSSASTGMIIHTKDIDFDSPGVRKKLYKVLVTYTTSPSAGAASNVIVDYDVDGGTTFGYDFADGTQFASTELAVANGWKVAELKPDVSSEANNIKSFRLRFAAQSGQSVPTTFKINDISCIYRKKPPR